MKTALKLFLLAAAGFGWSAGVPVVAQQPTTPYDPAYSEVVPGGAPQQPNNLPGNAQTLAASAPEAQAPASGNSQPTDDGLWDGASSELGCSICGDGNCAPAEWYVEQDVRLLGRSRSRRVPISIALLGYDSFGNAVYADVLDAHSVTPDLAAGWGMTIGHNFARDAQNRDHFVEFSFWGLNSWDDSNAVTGTRKTSQGAIFDTTYGSLSTPYIQISNAPPFWGFNYADLQTIEYKSTVNNFEINGRFNQRNRPDRLVAYPDGRWRRECQPGMQMSYLYGLRFFQLNESFDFHSESQIDTSENGVLVSSRHYTGDYDIVAHNNILGLQVGAEMNFRQCRWTWGVRAKAGPCVNFSDQVSDISSGRALDPGYVRRVAGSKIEASLIGEVGFQAAYKFRPNLVGRAAYDFMWVTGVASAPDQLQFEVEPINRVNNNGLAFFQGVTLGLEWLW